MQLLDVEERDDAALRGGRQRRAALGGEVEIRCSSRRWGERDIAALGVGAKDDIDHGGGERDIAWLLGGGGEIRWSLGGG